MLKCDGVRKKGAREAFKVDEEALNDDGKTLKGEEGA